MSEGADCFADHEILEIFLFDVIPRANTNPIAHRLIDRFGSLDGVFRASVSELCTVNGVGTATAEYIKEYWKRYCLANEEQLMRLPMTSFERAANYLIWRSFAFFPNENEVKTVILLSKDMRVTSVQDIIDEASLSLTSECTDVLNVIIGVRKKEFPTSGFYPPDARLLDVIFTDGFNAQSLME